MRWLGLLVLGACQFTPGLSSGPGPADATAGDAPGDDAAVDASIVPPDAPPDAPPQTAFVRLIDLDDTKITGGPHTDFPLLVSLSETWLRDETNGGDVARADGFDIFFSADQAGQMPLAHEVELYDPATGTLVAWVKLPTLEAQSVLYLHYGDHAITTSQENATAVWMAGYEEVLHLAGGGDSTAKNTVTATGNVVAATGKIAGGQSFDGAGGYLGTGSDAAIDDIFAGGGTAEGWFYANSFGESSFGRVFDKGNTDGWALYVDDVYAPSSLSFNHGSDGTSWGHWTAPDNSVSLATWHHVAVVYDKDSSANVPTIYLDGASVALSGFGPTGTLDSDASFDALVGNRASEDRTFDGVLDELRLSSVARSTGWIETEVRNQSDPASFYTVSAPL